MDLLFLGNSYTFQNELDQRVREALVGLDAATWQDGETVRLAEGGQTFTGHLARTAEDGSAWQAALAVDGATWDFVVLQEQSQIPGFPTTNTEYRASVDAAVALDDLAEARGAQVFFLNTWARRDGDAQNADRFPDFLTMEAHLEAGYLEYRDRTSTAERPTWIAPAGPAFARVHAGVLAAGGDPASPESDFARLYSADGSHPSALGTWLAAYVVATSMTGRTPVGLPTPSGLEDADALLVQTAAADTVFDSTLVYTYPWTGSGGTDTGTDTAAAKDTDSPADPGPAAEGQPADCGCSTSRPPWGTAALMLALTFVRRRRVA